MDSWTGCVNVLLEEHFGELAIRLHAAILVDEQLPGHIDSTLDMAFTRTIGVEHFLRSRIHNLVVRCLVCHVVGNVMHFVHIVDKLLFVHNAVA